MFLSKSQLENLFVFQYPSKKLNFNLDKSEVVNSCIKPLNQDVKVEFALDTASKHYDSFKGDQFALAADGARNAKNATFRSGTMDRQAFVSTRPMENINKYVVGIYQDHEIHACPLNGILQMRPSFSYFDKSDSRNKAEKKAENEADMDEEEPKQITVQFARTENDNTRKAREKSFGALEARSADEAWCETMWHTKDSQQATMERMKMFTVTGNAISNGLNLSNEKYIEALIPLDRGEHNVDEVLPTSVISMAQLRLMSLSDQIKVILKDGIKYINLNSILITKMYFQ